jgi:hypothetical protein
MISTLPAAMTETAARFRQYDRHFEPNPAALS